MLQGIVNSDTVGWTSQAAVSTVGRHQVHAIKPVMFDGYQITTRRPKIWVDVQNHNVAARTPYDGIPILDWIAQSTVRSEVRRRQAWADSDTAASVAERLGPKFNRDADRRLAKLNRRWRDEWMSQYRELWPKSFAIRTTDSEVQLSASWPDAPALTAAAMKSLPNGTHHDEITIRIHESVLNSALNRLPISGKAFSEKQLRTAVETLIAYIGGKIEPKKSDDDEPVLENVPGMTPMVRMAKETPVRVKIEDGTFRLIVKAGIELAGQTILAEDEISMPLTLADKQLAWRVDPGNLSFAKADNGMNVVGMVDTIVRNRLADAIPSTSYPKSLPVADPDLPIDSMRMTRMQATTGWLTISFDAEPRDKTSIREQEYQIPRQTSPVESQPPAEVVPPRLLPVPDNEIPDTTTARRPSASRVTARAVRVPTHSPVPINNTWATFDRNASTRTRVPSDFLR